MAAVLTVLYILSITPLRLFGAVDRPGRGGWAVLRIWGVPVRLDRMSAFKKPGGLRLSLPALRGAVPVLRLLNRGISVKRLDVDIRLGGWDAAHLAVLTGLIRGVGGLWPRARLRCRPAWGQPTALRGTCILETRLGILWTAALAGLIAQRRGRKREETT